MVAGIRCVLPGLKATRSSSGSRQRKRLSDVFKQDLIIPLGTPVCVSGQGSIWRDCKGTFGGFALLY